MWHGRWRLTPAAGGATAVCSLVLSSRSNGSTAWECPDSPDLNPSNRPVRTRMPGGVAGVRSLRPPPMPILFRARDEARDVGLELARRCRVDVHHVTCRIVGVSDVRR